MILGILFFLTGLLVHADTGSNCQKALIVPEVYRNFAVVTLSGEEFVVVRQRTLDRSFPLKMVYKGLFEKIDSLALLAAGSNSSSFFFAAHFFQEALREERVRVVFRNQDFAERLRLNGSEIELSRTLVAEIMHEMDADPWIGRQVAAASRLKTRDLEIAFQVARIISEFTNAGETLAEWRELLRQSLSE